MEGPRVGEVPNSRVERVSLAPRCRNTSRLNKYLQPRQASLINLSGTLSFARVCETRISSVYILQLKFEQAMLPFPTCVGVEWPTL